MNRSVKLERAMKRLSRRTEGVVLAVCLLTPLGCKSRTPPTVQEECPWAQGRGLSGTTYYVCAVASAQDRSREFLAATGIKATCDGDIFLSCSGVTMSGAPVRFKCDGNGCELIPQWLW